MLKMNRPVLAWTISLSLGMALVAPVQAQTQPQTPNSGRRPASATNAERPVPPSIEKFMKIRAPNSPTLAPDGTLFVRDWPDGVNQLYKRAPGTPPTAPMTRLTDFADGVNGYSLSHDGKWIIL